MLYFVFFIVSVILRTKSVGGELVELSHAHHTGKFVLNRKLGCIARRSATKSRMMDRMFEMPEC